jgi:hypothetical protein
MKIIDFFTNFKEKINSKKKVIKDDTVQERGERKTFLVATAESGFIDIVFFSGLSVTLYSVFGFKVVPAGLVLGLMSVVIIFGKAWCAMRISQINELISHLKALKHEKCCKALKKPRRFWGVLHKLCISVSLLTAMSLSVVSVGDGIRKNQNEIKKANEEITALAELINANSIGQSKQREIIYSSVSVSTNSTTKAQEDAAKIWPIIEEYRNERAEFEATGIPFSSKEIIEWRGEEIIPDTYWDKQNSLVQTKVKAAGRNLSINQIRNITSEAALAQQIKNEIENLNKNTSKDDLLLLDTQTKDAMITAIRNLEGRFKWPDAMGGGLVEFDESNPSLALTTLKDLKAAYENDTGDVGESAKIFVLLGPAIDNAFSAKTTLENVSKKKSVSSFGATEMMIMAFILFSGLLVELLIYAFTPKPIITRKVFEKYNFDEDLDIEDIMYQINRKYVSKGVLTIEEFNAKVEENKIISDIPETLEEYKKLEKKKNTTPRPKVEKKEKEFSSKVDNSVKEIEEMLSAN